MAVAPFLQDQIIAIDSTLLNAYGTVYKLAAKNLVYELSEYEMSSREELFMAKNTLFNLSSILDYCCTALHYCYHNRTPTAQEGRRIKFPCDFNELSRDQMDPVKWEKMKMSNILGEPVSNIYHQRLQGVFHSVQFKGGDTVDESVSAFYTCNFCATS